MKTLLFFLLLYSVNALGQDSVNYKTVGYCGTKKLRDIDATYGEAAFTTKATVLTGTMIKRFLFDYGQHYKKDKEAHVNNVKGEILTFTSIAEVLNFFDYNGWDYMSTVEMNSSYILLFRKKKQ